MPNLSQGGTWGPLPRCPKGCWVKKKNEHQLIPYCLPSCQSFMEKQSLLLSPPTLSRGPGGFLEAKLTHLNLHTKPSTLQTAQAQLLLLALTGAAVSWLGTILVLYPGQLRRGGGFDFPTAPYSHHCTQCFSHCRI